MNLKNFVIKLIQKYGYKPKAKVYKVRLTQIDSDDPTTVNYENTLGEINWNYLGAGEFEGVLPYAIFTATNIFAPNIILNTSDGVLIKISYVSSTTLNLIVSRSSVGPEDGWLNSGIDILLEVYPQ